MNKSLIIYHGSDKILRKPQFGKGSPRNDYGLGFYCTESVDLAKEWACTEAISGYANQYRFDLTGLKVLQLSAKRYTVLHWLTILLQNRTFETRNQVAALGKEYLLEHFAIDISIYDVIRGYRADDSYFSFAQDFLNNAITVQKLADAMKLGKLGEQIVLKSPEAFSRLEYLGCEKADRSIYYPLRKSRDELARSTYFSGRKDAPLTADDLFLADLVRGEVSADDPRIQ